MSQLQSTLLSEKPLIEGNSVTLPIVKVGTKAYSSTGKAFTLTKCALESGAESWKGGIITVNHQVREKGFISKAWFEDPFVYAKLDELSAEAVESVNSAAFRGVSQECEPLEIKSTNVTKLNGSGLTLVFYPHKPACSREMGCGVVASTEVAANDEERHVFDVAVLNNAGKQIKVKEISVWLYDDETDSPDRIKEEITRIVGYDGLGTFFVYDRDDSLSIGDEIPEDLEPVHTVMITVSNSPIFNFGLNSPKGTTQLESSGGSKVPESDDKITQLESTIKQKNGLISTKDQEITDLKSTNAKLENDLKAKDGQIASTVQAAVKAALESHDAEYRAKQDHENAVKGLSSFMKEDTMKEFLVSNPSVEVIKSTTIALKASSSKQVGTSGGETPDSLNSIHDDWNAATGGDI